MTSEVYSGDFPEDLFPPKSVHAAAYARRLEIGYERMSNSSIVLVGLARNVSQIIARTASRMEKLGSSFDRYQIYIFENDSSDGTVDQLKAWAERNPRMHFTSEQHAAPASLPIRCTDRAARMAAYRAACQAMVRKDFFDYQFVAIIDTDLEGGWSHDGIASTFGYSDWDFVGSNGLIYRRSGFRINATLQYDAWAYRDSPDYRPMGTKTVNRIEYHRGEPMVPLPCCFGGLGLYRMPAYLAGEYSGGDIEHVSFHRSIRNCGFDRTFINPDQIAVYGRRNRSGDRLLLAVHSMLRNLFPNRFQEWRFPNPIKQPKEAIESEIHAKQRTEIPSEINRSRAA